MKGKEEAWNFAVVGCNPNDVPKYLGFFDNYEEAVKFLKNMENIGWRRVAVFDAALKEVKTTPKLAG